MSCHQLAGVSSQALPNSRREVHNMLDFDAMVNHEELLLDRPPSTPREEAYSQGASDHIIYVVSCYATTFNRLSIVLC